MTRRQCQRCGRTEDCKNDLLYHVIRDHDADMATFPLASQNTS